MCVWSWVYIQSNQPFWNGPKSKSLTHFSRKQGKQSVSVNKCTLYSLWGTSVLSHHNASGLVCYVFDSRVCFLYGCTLQLRESAQLIVTMNEFYIEESHGKNIADDRLLSRSGFTAVPQQSAWMSWVEGSGRRLFEEPVSLSDPLNVQLRLIKGHRSSGKTLT